MATSMSSLVDAGLVKEMAAPVTGRMIRRRIDPRTGLALVVLGHAIEHLADQFVYDAGTGKPHRAQLDAIRLLLSRNRDLYLACPEVPTFWQGLRSLFRRGHRGAVKSSGLGSGLSHGRI
jgi:hypothetical protein